MQDCCVINHQYYFTEKSKGLPGVKAKWLTRHAGISVSQDSTPFPPHPPIAATATQRVDPTIASSEGIHMV